MKNHIRDAFEGVRPVGFARHHLALAAALLVAAGGAQALGLGKLNVQSALGETMRAEIDVTSLTSEEAATLKVRVAPPESYRATGVDYNAVLSSAQVQVVRQGSRTVLRVSSDRAVQEPFVDVILELSWSTGRLVREYTLLFDPPSLPKPATAPAAVAAGSAASSEGVSAQASATTTTLPRIAPAPVAGARAPVTAPAPIAIRPPVTAASEYRVQPGDSLSKVAGRTQVSGISLDQMLVGLFRNNPDAFIDGNMNRLKAGSTLQVPGSEALAAVSAGEARQIIQAQSADFSAYRQRLASAAPTLQSSESERQSKGQVQAAVEDRKPAAAPTPDKLTLSKAGAAASEAKLSKDTEKKDAAARVAELTRNVEELKKLSNAAGKSPAAEASAAAPAPAPVAAALPTPPVVPAVEPASAPAPAPVAAASAAASSVQARASAPLAPPPAAEPPGFVEQLLDSPVVGVLACVLVAALGGFGLYRLRSRRPAHAAETGFHESRLQPDSFFGGTGGQRVDTRDAQHSGQSSMSYSLSQLDAIGDVDPVAEADVYLAYGRDLQAEEILKEAMRSNPDRMAIRTKLLEVYAKRRDTKGFELLATQLYTLTRGEGEDWAKAQEMGAQIDPDNALFKPGGAPIVRQTETGELVEALGASTMPQSVLPTPSQFGASGLPMPQAAHDSGSMDLDLDLDLGDATAEESDVPASLETTRPLPPAHAPAHTPAPRDMGTLDFSSAPMRTPAAAPEAPTFDLSDISLDLDLPTEAPTRPAARVGEDAHDSTFGAMELPPLDDVNEDPLSRKLELAEEFRQIGDTDGARDLLQEVIARASGSVKTRAQTMLADLG